MKGLLALIRPPNVFTAFADALAGLLIVWGTGGSVADRACAIVLASGCLYLAGIVLNDVFDREIDAVERPTRPIPAGLVPVGTATAIGVGLLVAGVLIAAWVGRDALQIAAVLASMIVTYDAGAKKTRIGPLVMGSCRGLNLAMGIAAGMGTSAHWPPIAIAGPIVLAAYIAALTYIARDEVDGNTARRARTGLLAMLVIAIAVAIAVVRHAPPLLAWVWVAVAFALLWRNWSPVWTRHDGPSTGRAIGGGILLIPIIDASIAAVAGCPWWALAIATLCVPVLILKQFFSPT